MTNPLSAVTAAREFQPEIAFLDHGMPVLDGFQLAHQLRTEFKDRIFMIALTGYSNPEFRTRSARAGFDAHLLKPAELGLIEAAIAAASAVLPKR